MDTAAAVSRGPHSMILDAVAPQGLKALPPRLLDCLFYISSEDKEKWLGDWIRMLSRLSEGKDGGGVQAEGTPEAVTLEDLFSRWPLTSLYQDRKITEPALQESKAARTRWLGHHSLFAALAWMPGSMVAGPLSSSTAASDVAAPDYPLTSGTTSSGYSTQTTPTVSLHQLTVRPKTCKDCTSVSRDFVVSSNGGRNCYA
ncbi:hypothetical protein V5799_010375 [Amblyomma americanum]|uniref:Uncharacterized protein n=1 Tax=Amblyomma americanum TaxID=6943 RepID=A0AAQ4EK04_AMBAM